MLKMFAFIENNIIVKTELLTEEDCINKRDHYLIVDITDLVPQPLVGWILDGNKLIQQPESIPDANPKIFSYMRFPKAYDNTRPPLSVDYVTQLSIKLFRKSTLVKGECTREEFFEFCNGTTYTNPIVREDHVFTRDALGFATSRTTTVSWYCNNGTLHPEVKILKKYYSSAEQIEEGKTRRGNLINALQMPCIGLISIATLGTPNANMAVILEGRRFLLNYKLEFDAFIGESNKGIISCLNNPADPKYISTENYYWIDAMTPYGVSIRQYLIGEMSI